MPATQYKPNSLYQACFRDELASIEAYMTRQQMLDELGVNTRMGDYRNRLRKHALAVQLAHKRLAKPKVVTSPVSSVPEQWPRSD